ncbi:septum formation protein Maf [Thiocapsa imhoffii]|uniref:dTTP/UTP pyrophosphatase n=1 Tax=Thiocapsa imhoffii TaxID=382777 RepID=A0A9X0WK38_9GAMM|nr:nucleoside triphosphate pyrophosphatase [Thiocapsa imhoffii]MBK1645955.1 septum formation protein Maf [Thiocapsa imhoffii]
MIGCEGEPRVYLASRSPRRRLLLEQIGVRALVIEVAIDETPRPLEPPAAYVRRVAAAKARAGCAARPAAASLPVLAADTAVVLDTSILGQPGDRAAAVRMLRRLAGRSHEVFTAVTLIAGGREQQALSVNQVTFRALTESEILKYCDTGEPLDKAGAYGIQGLGAVFVERLQGSYSGVMGLPLLETAQLLAAAGVDVLAAAARIQARGADRAS